MSAEPFPVAIAARVGFLRGRVAAAEAALARLREELDLAEDELALFDPESERDGQ
jgi:hypothetical protein